MRTEICNFSGHRVYPGKGKRYVRVDGKLLVFSSTRCEALFLSRKNPRKIKWTVLYRKLHKKGAREEVQKKRTKRTVKLHRSVEGNTLQSIMEKKSQTSEVRKTLRENAIKAAKDKIKEKRDKKVQLKQQAQAKVIPKSANKAQNTAKQPRAPKIRVGGKR